MYSWVVHLGSTWVVILFLFSESEEDKEKAGGRGIVVRLFIYFFYVNSFLYIFFYVNSFLYSFFTIIIIKCKVLFSSHSSSSHYSMQGFVFISFHPFGGVFYCKYE